MAEEEIPYDAIIRIEIAVGPKRDERGVFVAALIPFCSASASHR